MALFGEDDSQHPGVFRLTQRHTDCFPVSPTVVYQDGRFNLTAKVTINEKKPLFLKNRQGDQGSDNPLTPLSPFCQGYCVALRQELPADPVAVINQVIDHWVNRLIVTGKRKGAASFEYRPVQRS